MFLKGIPGQRKFCFILITQKHLLLLNGRNGGCHSTYGQPLCVTVTRSVAETGSKQEQNPIGRHRG